jgi:DNA-binding response OmpR family regulator
MTAPLRSPYKILIIDPDMKSPFSFANFNIQVAASQESAEAILRQGDIDVVITELFQPGRAAMGWIVYLHHEWPNVIIIVATSQSGVRDKVGAFQSGAGDFIVKPASNEQLINHTKRLLRIKQILSTSRDR